MRDLRPHETKLFELAQKRIAVCEQGIQLAQQRLADARQRYAELVLMATEGDDTLTVDLQANRVVAK